MSLSLTARIRQITDRVTGRDESVFAPDLEAHAAAVREEIAGRRVLVAGGAGTIGAATLLALVDRNPAEITVLDPCENNLAELVRSIRGGARRFDGELRVQPLPYGSRLAARFVAELPPHDVVLSFAALKHVRSERDPYSTLRLLDVNLVEADRFLAALRRAGHGARGVFFVSTDKAANPVSLMGASKRIMELLLWAHTEGDVASLLDGGTAAPLPRVTTARFANVAFSDGSLPWAFLQRLEKRQPLAAPRGVRRYLLSPWEAGDLCLLAATRAPASHVVVPKLDADGHTVTFPEVAEATLACMGLEPAWYDDEAAALAHVEDERARGRYPVVVTRADTSGEKEMEEFVADGETAIDAGFVTLSCIAARPTSRDALVDVLRRIERACTGEAAGPSKAEIVEWLASLVDDLRHRETGTSLDARL
ncbi:MAG: polysaccharide biosynthesis protein [Myxococcota bacterium]|nr:polysaccharide biosynthesis protein [Myxococcota bacterium]